MKVSHEHFKFTTADEEVLQPTKWAKESSPGPSRGLDPCDALGQPINNRSLRVGGGRPPTPTRGGNLDNYGSSTQGVTFGRGLRFLLFGHCALGSSPMSFPAILRKQHSLILLFGTLLVLFASSAAAAEEASQVHLNSVKVIYLIPMKDRMDHYLTTELVRWGQYQVTIDPHLADGILSDVPHIDLKGLMEDPPRIVRTSKASRGIAFLIDPKSENLIWSTSKDTSTSYLIHTSYKSAKDLAHEIVEQMKKDISKPK